MRCSPEKEKHLNNSQIEDKVISSIGHHVKKTKNIIFKEQIKFEAVSISCLNLDKNAIFLYEY